MRLFLLCFLAKRMFLRNFGSSSFLMPFLCHFQNWLCMAWFLDLAISALKPAAPGTGRVILKYTCVSGPPGISCFPHPHRRWQFLVFRSRLLSLVSDPAEAAALASSGS